MTWTAWFALVVTALVIIGLARNLAADALIWGAVVACGLAGILSIPEMFVGFTNTGMLTIAALFVVAAGVRETGALDLVGRAFLGKVKSLPGVMRRLGMAVPLLSAFLNNTPVVAMFIPMLSGWCAKHRVSPSRLLIPLSYMSILGGMTTLIGTSTNLVVQGMMAKAASSNPALSQSLRPMGLFEIGAVGIPCAILGIVYLLAFSGRLLPQRIDMLEEIGASPREYLAEMKVGPDCRMIGQHVEEAGLRHLHGLFLAEIIRDGEIIAPVQPDHVIEADDVLTFTGVLSTMVELEKKQGLTPVADPDYEHELSELREECCRKRSSLRPRRSSGRASATPTSGPTTTRRWSQSIAAVPASRGASGTSSCSPATHFSSRPARTSPRPTATTPTSFSSAGHRLPTTAP